MRAYQRFLNYITYGTASDETTGTTPSTAGQLTFGAALKEELLSLGASEVRQDADGYVYAVLPATEGCEDVTPIGFIAHMDTSPECEGKGVRAQIVADYDGGDLPLGDGGKVLKVADFPHLPTLRGRTLITTDGTTLLGADDKAGIAEIMTLAERLVNEKLPHGKLCLAFTPDEEIGEGADRFDVPAFGATYAYTVDGGEEGSVEYENFNAGAAEVTFRGFSVHPGSAKNTMINAALAAMEFNAMLPAADVPAHTDGYEGFFHLTAMTGDVSEAKLSYIVRDHDAAAYDGRMRLLSHTAAVLNEKYGEGTVTLTTKEQYRNMAEMVRPHPFIIDIAREAAEACGVSPTVAPIRGGTDGARLSFMGLPCPNLGTGGYAFHGEYEHVTVEGMDKVTDILLTIVKAYAEGKDRR